MLCYFENLEIAKTIKREDYQFYLDQKFAKPTFQWPTLKSKFKEDIEITFL